MESHSPDDKILLNLHKGDKVISWGREEYRKNVYLSSTLKHKATKLYYVYNNTVAPKSQDP